MRVLIITEDFTQDQYIVKPIMEAMLAGHDLPPAWDWQVIRAEEHPKENYYLPFAQQRNVHRQPAQGRSTLALEAAKRYARIRQLCPEDISALEQRLRAILPAS